MPTRGPKIFNKFSSHEDAAKADDLLYSQMSFEDKLQELLSILHSSSTYGQKIARVVKKYPLGKGSEDDK